MDKAFLGFALSLFLAIVLLVSAIYAWWNTHHSSVVKRIDQRIRAMSAGGHGTKEQLSIVKQRLLSHSPAFTRFLLLVPRIHLLDRLLLQAGSRWTVSRFLAWSSLPPLLVLFVGSAILHRPLMASLVIAALCAVMPSVIVRRQRTKRLRKLEEQLPEAADLISRALRAGHAFSAALGMAGEELPEPFGSELRTTFDEINYGISMNDALTNLASRVPVGDLRYLVIAVLIQREAGGNLAEILQSISQIIRERIKLVGKIRVLSAEGRMSAWVLSLLPFAVALALAVLNPKFFNPLWQDPLGLRMIVIALVFMAMGVLWMRKTIHIHI